MKTRRRFPVDLKAKVAHLFISLSSSFRLRPGAVSTAVVVLAMLVCVPAARSHEVLPSIADMTVVDDVLEFAIQANLEGFVAGIDLSDAIQGCD